MLNFKVGDKVVYSKSKQSGAPGPRAQDVAPSPKGDDYTYVVDKYWIVREVHPDGHLTLMTRRGKTHVIPIDDPCLRLAGFWERVFHAKRFPVLNGEQPAER